MLFPRRNFRRHLSRLNKTIYLQALIVAVFFSSFLIFSLLGFETAVIYIAPTVAGIVFLGFRLIFHRLHLFWIVLCTLCIVITFDIAMPWLFGFYGEIKDIESILSNLPILTMIVIMEVALEEELELIDENLKKNNPE